MTVLVARVLLLATFAVAGIAKLTDPVGVRRMTISFGAPTRLARPLAWVLIAGELGVSAALAIGSTARIGAFAALALLLVFGAAGAIALRRGRNPECRCFGGFQSTAFGWSTVARNALLATFAGVIATNGGMRLPLAVAAVIAIASWLMLALRQPHKLRRGGLAPAITLADQDGGDASLGSLVALGRPVLLVFADPDCAACRELLPEVAGWQARFDSELTVAVVSGAEGEDNTCMAGEFGLRAVFTDEQRTAAVAYGVTATPSAILVDARHRIAAAPARGAQEIAALVASETKSGHDLDLQRRAMLVRAATGLAAVTASPLITAVAAAARSVTRPKKLKIDGAWLCDQRYALCTFAACKPSKCNKDVSICRCKVKTGYSVGFKNCEKRAPKGRRLHSNFSLQDVTRRTRVLKCSKRGLWVQCLDVVCEVDRHDPKHAHCQCVNEKTTNFYTFGGDCKTQTCDSVIWSATTAPFPGGAQYQKGLRQLGVPFRVPKSCPTHK